MFLTTRGRYAVMAVLDIHKYGNGLPVKVTSISGRQNISTSYLEQLFLSLKKAGIVRSIRGPGGGYTLAKDAIDISVFEILSAAGERLKVTKCKSKDLSCTGLAGRCETHQLWKNISTDIFQYLSGISLNDIINNNYGTRKI